MTVVIAVQKALTFLFHDKFLDGTKMNKTASDISDDILHLDKIELHYMII